MIVIFCGVPACGKSTAAEETVQRLEDLGLDYKMFVSDNVSDKVYKKVFRFLEDNNEENDHLIVDATFYKEKWREKVLKIAKENHEELLTVYLHCSLEASLRRNKKRKEGEKVPEKAIHIINNEMERPENPDLEFDTDLTEPERISEKILEKLSAVESRKIN